LLIRRERKSQLNRLDGARFYRPETLFNRLLWFIFLSIVSLGCPKRVETGRLGAAIDPKEVLDLTSKVEGQVLSIKGEGRLRVEAPGSKGAPQVFVAAARPAFLRFEVLGFFGQPEAILVSNGKSFALLQNDQRKYFRGPASPENISRLLPVVLPGPELVRILLGAAPRGAAEDYSAQPLDDGQVVLVTLSGGQHNQKLWIRQRDDRVLKSEVRGPVSYDLLFEDFQAKGPINFPHKITLFASSASAVLELRYREVGVNVDLEPSLFKLTPPEGANVIDLDENGRPRSSAL